MHVVIAGSSTTAFVDNNGEEATVHHNDYDLFLQQEDLCCSVCKAYIHTLSFKASRSKKTFEEIPSHSHVIIVICIHQN